jgi:hypothetical protein
MPDADNVGVKAKARAEADERGPGDRELLVRGGHERHRLVVRVDDLAGREVDRERGGAREGDPCAAQALGERRAGARRGRDGRRRNGHRDEGDDREQASPHVRNRRS